MEMRERTMQRVVPQSAQREPWIAFPASASAAPAKPYKMLSKRK